MAEGEGDPVKEFLKKYGAEYEKNFGPYTFRMADTMPKPQDVGIDKFFHEHPRIFEMYRSLAEFLESRGLVPVIKFNNRGPLYMLWVGVPPKEEHLEIVKKAGLKHGDFSGFVGISLVKLLPEIYSPTGESIDPEILDEWFIHIDNVQSDLLSSKEIPKRLRRKYGKSPFVDTILEALEEWIRTEGHKFGIKGISWAHLVDLKRRGVGTGKIASRRLKLRGLLKKKIDPFVLWQMLREKRLEDPYLDRVLKEIDTSKVGDLLNKLLDRLKKDEVLRKKVEEILAEGRKWYVGDPLRKFYIRWPKERGYKLVRAVLLQPFFPQSVSRKYGYGMEGGRLRTLVWLKRILD